MSALVDIKSSLVGILDTFRGEIVSNDRFRRMIWLIGYILICYLIVGVGELGESLDQEVEARRAELSRLSSTTGVSPDTWMTRLEAEQRTQNQLLEACWPARDQRLASADMQTMLQQITSVYSPKSSRLSLSEPERLSLETRDIWQIRAQLRGRMGLERIPSLINTIENSDTPLFVKRFLYIQQRGNNTLELTVEACFQGAADA